MINELVFVGHDGQAVTNSVKVAEKFGKEHKHVLESIRKLMTAENSAVLQMFEESTYINEQNKTQPMRPVHETATRSKDHIRSSYRSGPG